MFTQLFSSVFPALGSFFGTLAGLAMCPFGDILCGLNGSLTLTLNQTIVYVAENYDEFGVFFPVFNVFTGNVGAYHIIEIPRLFLGFFQWFLTLMASPVLDLPFIFAILILFAQFFVVFLLVKFLFGLLDDLNPL